MNTTISNQLKLKIINALLSEKFINTINGSAQPNATVLSSLAPVDLQNVKKVLMELKGNSIKTSQVNITLPYGQLSQARKAIKAGAFADFLAYSGKNVTYYNVSVARVQPQLQITADGVSQSNPNSTIVVRYPVLNGKTTYNVTALLDAQLLNNNTAEFSYSINGNTTSINASNIEHQINLYNVPITKNITITFDTKGNENYSAVDPSVIFVPVNILYYIPVTLTNSRGFAYPTNAQINVTVGAGNYINYETANMINAEWFYLNGTIIPSWLQGNTQSQGQVTNLDTSNSLEYWLLIHASQNFLSASAVNTVYFGFAGTGMGSTAQAVSNTLMTGVVTGEAPQLAPNANHYGALDDGANVFILYQNFVGTTIPAGWANSFFANSIVSNGLNMKGEAFVANTLKVVAGNIIEANFNIRQVGSGGLLYGAGITSNIVSNVFPLNGITANLVTNGIAFTINAIGTSSFTANFGIRKNDTTTLVLAASSNVVIGVAVNAPSVAGSLLQNGVVVAVMTGNIPSSPSTGGYHIEFVSNSIGRTAALYYINWTRVRAFPPNGIMATATFPSSPIANALLLIGNPTPPLVSNTIIDVGEYSVINMIVTNGFAPYIGAWAWNPPNILTTGSNSNTTTANILIGNLANDVLTVNAYAADNVIFTFNTPSTTTANTFYANILTTNTVYGVWQFNAVVQDAGANYIGTFNTLTIYPALVAGAPTESNTILDSGQYDTFTSAQSGGTGTYSFQWYSGTSSTCASDAAISSGTSATYTIRPVSGNYYCYQVTDLGTSPTHYQQQSSTIQPTVNTAPTAALSYSNTLLDSGQTENALLTLASGTSKFTANLINTTLGGNVRQGAANIIVFTVGGSNSITFPVRSPTQGNVFTMNYLVTDNGVTSNYVFNAVAETFTVNAAPTGSITFSNALLDSGQYETITVSTAASTGVSPFTINVVNVTGSKRVGSGNYLINTIGGSNALTSFVTTSDVDGNTFTYKANFVDYGPSANYIFNSLYNSITVNTVLAAGAITSPFNAVDNGQSMTLTSNPSGGTLPYASYQWYTNYGSTVTCSGTGNAITSSGTSATYSASPTTTNSYAYLVTDSASTAVSQCSAGYTVGVVDTALSTPTLTESNTLLDSGQWETLTVGASGGSGAYTINFFNVTGLSSQQTFAYNTFGATTPYPVNTYGQSCVTYSNNIYCVGGSYQNQFVYYAPILQSSALGAWSTSANSYPFGIELQQCVTNSNNIYCVGGSAFGIASDEVYYAPIFSNGATGTWTSSNAYPENGYYSSCVNYSNNIYCMAGSDNNVYYAPILSTGAVGAWQNENSYPVSGAHDLDCALNSNIIYCTGSYEPSVYYVPISPSGTIGIWTSTNTYPIFAAGQGEQCVTNSNEIYCIGAQTSGPPTPDYYAPIFSSGGVGTWQSTANYPITGTALDLTCVTYSKSIYCIAGTTAGYTTNTVYYAPLTSTGIANTLSYSFQVNSPVNSNIFIFNAIVTDAEASSTSVNSIQNSFTVNTVPTTPTITASNTPTVIDGKYELFTASWPTTNEGTAAFTYNYWVINTVDGSLIANMLIVTNSFTSNTWLWGPIPVADDGNTISANIVITDSATTNEVFNSVGTPTITINPSFVPMSTPVLLESNTLLDSGQWETLNTTITGGASPYTVNFFNVTAGATGWSMGYQQWLNATPYPTNDEHGSCVTYTNNIYCVGGAGSDQFIYYAPILQSGVLGSWATSGNTYPVGIQNQQCVSDSNNIYCVGGYADGVVSNSVYVAPIFPSGEVGTWASANAYPTNIAYSSCFQYSNSIYCFGGYNSVF